MTGGAGGVLIPQKAPFTGAGSRGLSQTGPWGWNRLFKEKVTPFPDRVSLAIPRERHVGPLRAQSQGC